MGACRKRRTPESNRYFLLSPFRVDLEDSHLSLIGLGKTSAKDHPQTDHTMASLFVNSRTLDYVIFLNLSSSCHFKNFKPAAHPSKTDSRFKFFEFNFLEPACFLYLYLVQFR